MSAWRVPFNRPSFTGDELTHVAAALNRGHISGGGPFTLECQARLEAALGVPKALLTTSGTHALEMAALLLDIKPGDEVIVPSFTFVSTANAFALRGGCPVFVDIRRDTLNIDESLVPRAVSNRTKAIVVVHYAGVSCEMNAILQVAQAHGIPVVEDNAHGLFATYRGRRLGSFGDVSALSFHETKNITCGEGGAVLVNRADLVDRAEIIREKGTDRSRFFRGQVDRYTWVDVGSSYLPSDLLAAFLLAQLQHSESIQGRRRHIWLRYRTLLAGWAAEHDVMLPYAPPYVEQAFHMFYLLMPTERSRDSLLAFLRARSILATFHYVPLHSSAFGRRFGTSSGSCPVTDEISGRLVRLPFFTNMSEEDMDLVVEALYQFTA